MFSYGRTSRNRRDECHPDLILIMNEAIKEKDFSILCGIRSKDSQNAAFDSGKSQVKWPHSKHNIDIHNPKCEEYPDKSIAFDIAEYHADLPGHIDWSDKYAMWHNAKIILNIAKDLKLAGMITHDLRWGGDWDGDGIPVFLDSDETFWDAVHFELVLEEQAHVEDSDI